MAVQVVEEMLVDHKKEMEILPLLILLKETMVQYLIMDRPTMEWVVVEALQQQVELHLQQQVVQVEQEQPLQLMQLQQQELVVVEDQAIKVELLEPADLAVEAQVQEVEIQMEQLVQPILVVAVEVVKEVYLLLVEKVVVPV